jgi:hypothetical protein
MRFDFHYTTTGWQISEVNSDVPGGYTEAGPFASLVSQFYPGAHPPGDPGEALAKAMLCQLGGAPTVAALSSPGHMEDNQVAHHIAALLEQEGCSVLIGDPSQVVWRDRRAHFAGFSHPIPLDGIFRFVQAEWLPLQKRLASWEFFVAGGSTPVLNPGHAILSESKRLPLLWPCMRASIPTLKSLFPNTCEPGEVNWRRDRSWALKSAYSNNGDSILCGAWSDSKTGDILERQLNRQPEEWVAQRRFDPVWFETPQGPAHACIGVYTVDGKCSGAYARLASRPIIDFAARDVALLIDSKK